MARVAGVTPAELERVAPFFAQADADGDGVVGLAEGAAFFKMSGLPQSSLKAIWSLVADTGASGSRHQLTREQFCVAFQLIELALANGGAQCVLTVDLLPAPIPSAPMPPAAPMQLVPESPISSANHIDGPFSPGPESLSPGPATATGGAFDEDLFTFAAIPTPASEPEPEQVPAALGVQEIDADDDPFAPSPRTSLAASTPGLVVSGGFSSPTSVDQADFGFGSSGGGFDGHGDGSNTIDPFAAGGDVDTGDDPFASGDDPFVSGDDPFASGDDPFASQSNETESGNDAGKTVPPCSICFAEACKPGERDVSTTRCGHTFCRECLAAASAANPNCPNCRTPLVEPAPPVAPAVSADLRLQEFRNRHQRHGVESNPTPHQSMQATGTGGGGDSIAAVSPAHEAQDPSVSRMVANRASAASAADRRLQEFRNRNATGRDASLASLRSSEQFPRARGDDEVPAQSLPVPSSAQFDDDPFAFTSGSTTSATSANVGSSPDPFGGDDPFAFAGEATITTSANVGGADPFGGDDADEFDGSPRQQQPPPISHGMSSAREPGSPQFTDPFTDGSFSGDLTLNAEATACSGESSVQEEAEAEVEITLPRTASGFGLSIGEDAVLSGWAGEAGTAAEQRLASAGVVLGWHIVQVGGVHVSNRADVIARLGQETGQAQVSFTFRRQDLGPTGGGGGGGGGGGVAAAAVAQSGGGGGGGASRVERHPHRYAAGRVVAFETLANPSPSQSAMSAGTAGLGQAATGVKEKGRGVLTSMAAAPKMIAALEREVAALLKEQEVEVEAFERLRAKFEAELIKIAEDHEKNYERALKKDQKKGTGRHSADKWTTAAASDVRACEAKYANEMRTRADRVLNARQLVAELYLRGMEAIQVRVISAGARLCSGQHVCHVLLVCACVCVCVCAVACVVGLQAKMTEGLNAAVEVDHAVQCSFGGLDFPGLQSLKLKINGRGLPPPQLMQLTPCVLSNASIQQATQYRSGPGHGCLRAPHLVCGLRQRDAPLLDTIICCSLVCLLCLWACVGTQPAVTRGTSCRSVVLYAARACPFGIGKEQAPVDFSGKRAQPVGIVQMEPGQTLARATSPTPALLASVATQSASVWGAA